MNIDQINSPSNYTTDIETNQKTLVKKQSALNELLIATNTENLKTFITKGLIHSKSLFRKYYKDISELFPNYIPLFINRLPEAWVSACKEEEDIDVAIISVEISSENLDRNISFYTDQKGETFKGKTDNYSTVQAIYYEGVIPISSIKNIFFESEDVKKRFLDYKYSNFHPELLGIKVKPKLFKRSDKDLLQPDSKEDNNYFITIGEKPQDLTSYFESSARGGLLTMLLYTLPDVAESQNLINNTIQPYLLHQDSNSTALNVLPKQMQYIRNWIWKDPVLLSDFDTILLWHLMDMLAPSEPYKGLTSSTFLVNLQHHLDSTNSNRNLNISPSIKYDEFKQRFRQRYENIQSAVDQTIDPGEFFNDRTIKSKVIRALVLFLLRKDSIWSFHTERQLIKDWAISAEDLLFGNLLYGVWKGWDSIDDNLIPTDKKEHFAITSFMADFYNRTYVKSSTKFSNGYGLNITKNSNLWEKKIWDCKYFRERAGL